MIHDESLAEFILNFLLTPKGGRRPGIRLFAPYQSRPAGFSKKRYYNTVYSLRRSGKVKLVKKQQESFIELTKRGAIEALLLKAQIKKMSKWDGKWRLILFDIPETARGQRDVLRRLLVAQGFIRLQNSVFIRPFALNRLAVRSLAESGLIKYIRMVKVEEMDNDRALRKKFKLPILKK